MSGPQLLTLVQSLMCGVSGPMIVVAARNRLWAGAATFAALFTAAVIYLLGHHRLPWLDYAVPAAQLAVAGLYAGWFIRTMRRT